jgi:outer membrane protein
MDQSANRAGKRAHFAAAAAALLLCSTAAPAQQPSPLVYKIGFVDADRVLRESLASQKLQANLNADFQKREQEIVAGPAMDIQKRGAELAVELNLRRDDEMKQFITRTNGIIKRIAEAEKFDIVFLEATYVNSRIDMTDRVITALDAKP